MKSLTLALAAAFLLGCGPSQADEAKIRQTLTTQFPGVEIASVKKTAFAGLYEVYMDGQIVYVDPKAEFALAGDVLDLKTRRNITQSRLNELMAIDWNSLPLQHAIKTVKGDGSRKIAVFSDIDCPFCRRLEAELAKVDNLTVYTFLYPIEKLHPKAVKISRQIWCAPDRVKAWDDYIGQNILPTNEGNCDNPIAATIAYGESLRIGGTPTIFFANGQRQPGYLQAERLEDLLAAVKAGGVVEKKPVEAKK
jgi:thiol:disulfide interchange protein DsbC